jgi:hypothetical protein
MVDTLLNQPLHQNIYDPMIYFSEPKINEKNIAKYVLSPAKNKIQMPVYHQYSAKLGNQDE